MPEKLVPYKEHLDYFHPFDYVENIIDRVTGQLYMARKDEELLEIVVVDAGLFKSFDPFSKYQAPYVEITIEGPEGRQMIETSTCHPKSDDPTDEEEKEASFRPTWNERFMFRAAGGMFVRFDVCIEHHLRNRTLCGTCAFTAEDLWSRAIDGRQLLSIPLVHNQGGGWELEEELVGGLRLIVGRMSLETVEHLPHHDKKGAKLDKKHNHHHGYKGQTKPAEQKPESANKKAEVPAPQAQSMPVPMMAQSMPVGPMMMPPQSPIPMQSMAMMPSTAALPVPMQSIPMQSVPTQSIPRSQSTVGVDVNRDGIVDYMAAGRDRNRDGISDSIQRPMMAQSMPVGPMMTTGQRNVSIGNLVPSSLAPISVSPKSGRY